jgi:UDP-N-acetylmuramoyl-tripeptide--D-alanyl-D-alanine ligase
VIGISGSFGKTSIKNIVYDLLVNDFNVAKTPKSYNNKVGICKSINEYLSNYDEYFICEYGVDRVKGMDPLLRIVKPNVAIISEIGNQHLLSFKSVENILKEKMKLIESLDEYGIAIINNDNHYLREYDYKNRVVLRYGINHESDVMAKNINLYSTYSEFDLYIKNKFISRINIKLISIHNVENVLCGICACLAINMSIDDILKNIKNVNPIEHRLEVKKIDGIDVIDDAFNSNVKGFVEALEILKISRKYKIIITPGIIEQGDNNKEVSQFIAKRIIESVDYVFLVSNNSVYMEDYFKKHNFYSYSKKDSFIEAFMAAKEINKEKIILIENDLPNIYLK